MRSRSIGVAVVCAIVLAITPNALAQTVAVAQLSGTVVDEQGGTLPGVEVSVTHANTGFSRFVITGTRGDYVFTNLPVGPYRLSAKLSGFNAFEQTGIVLAVGDTRAVNVTMKLGAVTETIKVEANVNQVETRSTAIGLVVEEEQIVGLPLNGRQATQLVLLSGAAVETGGGLTSNRQYPNAVAISVAGGTGNSTLYLVDGGYNNDSGNNTGNAMPFPDALQEFRTETGVRPARYGMYTGATVNAVTRSGTNQYHGTGFVFGRHHAFNAIPYFNQIEHGGLGGDDGLVRSQTGGTFGGPLKTDKLFFFGGLQITKQDISPTTTNAIVPTREVLSGDFTRVMSAACRGGTARTLGAPFVNNRIDPALYSPFALNLLRYVPVADPAYDPDGCGRYPLAIPNNSVEQQFIGRLDYQVTTNARVFGRYFFTNYNHEPGFDSETNPNLLYASGNGLGIKSRMHTFAGGWDQVITPRLFSATRVSLADTTALRVQGRGLPTFATLGVNTYQYTNGDGQNFYNGANGGWPNIGFPGTFYTTTPSISQDLDWTKGQHSLSFGGVWTRPFFDGDGPFQANGIMTFSGLITRGANAQSQLPMADFLLGLPASFSQGGSQIVAEKQHYVGFYAQDVWRLSSNFTVNYGLRWEPFLAAKDQNAFTMAFVRERFDQGARSTVYPNAPVGLVFPGDPGFPSNGANTNNKLNQFAPRAGIIWDPRGDNVQTIRAAAGRFYDSPKLWQYGHHMLNPPYGNTVVALPPSSCPPPNANGCAVDLYNPWANTPGGDPLKAINYPRQFTSVQLPPTNVRFPLNGEYVSMPIDSPIMTVTQWNVSYQRQFWSRMLVDVSYLGNVTDGIWLGFEQNPAVYIPGTCVAGQYGLTAPGPCSNSSAVNVRARRTLTLANPVEGAYFGSVAQTYGGTGHYHGVRFTIEKRMSSGWSVSANYTRSTCVSQGEPGTDIVNSFPDPLDPTTNEGPCAADRPHLFNLSSVLQSRGLGGGFLHAFTKDWQLGWIFQARSGSPLTPATTGDSALTGLAATERPLIVSGVDPNLSSDERVPVSGGTAVRWFNMAAFAQNTPGVWGNVPRGYLRGPAFWNADMALSRNVRFGSSTVELRAEVFNVFNHVNWGNPNVTLGANNAGNVTTTANDQRIMQFAVKYGF
jgi:carboxypeptidase family protein/TonB-dependent receptor-like protein